MELSILIPARNEMFLARTVEDILKNIKADTEVIAVMDGDWAKPPVPQHDRVNVIKLSKSIGQRAATNLACKSSKAKYVMKIDAHCSFDKGFDRKMLDAFKKTGDNVTMVPVMRNLWAFDWKCYHCGWKKYQGPTPEKCEDCGKSDKIKRKMVWIGKNNPQSTTYCFDPSPKFQYFNDWKKRPEYKKDKEEKGLTETMSLQGSCWMLTRKKYWDLNICDEKFGGWGSQGIEVACKTWLSGGRVLVNHKTWYAHMFRTQGGDFSFPYQISNKDQKRAQDYARDLFYNNKWPKQIRPLSWLVNKFWPVRDWSDEDLKKLKKNDSKFSLSAQTSEQKSDSKPIIADSRPKEASQDHLQKGIVPSPPSKQLKLSEIDSELERGEQPNNYIQITEGKRLILLDVVDRSKEKLSDGARKHGIIYSIEPSKGVIYYADDEVNLKILIKKL
jgi:glycosyltransferase involved in cell wall biosynthesis